MLKLFQNLLLIFEFPIKWFFEASQKPKSNVIGLEIMAQGLKMQKYVHEYKTIFLEKRGKR